MKAILFHGDNLPTSLTDHFHGDKSAIDYSQASQNSNFVLDRFLHDSLSKAFQNKAYDVIFIPYTLSQQNYFELTGLRVAAHIRVTKEFRHHLVPIVFIGIETPNQIAKLSELGNILFTPGVFHIAKTDRDALKNEYILIQEHKPRISETEWEKCLKRLQLSPPANYQSHHSIDNELALLRWSTYLKCDNNILEVKENLQKGLYFKYYQALNPVAETKQGTPYLINGKGKVLLIDDEAKRGWGDFYRCFLQNNINNNTIKFDILEVEFKSLSQNEIIDRAIKKCEDADVVLLDLRLCDSDFKENKEPKELTGYKILEEIKKINKGIQVIITTASNKIWNYQSVQGLGANGYIIKRDDSNVAEDIKNLKQVVEGSINRASYLKPVNQSINQLSKSLTTAIKNKKFDKHIGKELIKILQLSYNMYEKANSKDDFAYAYISLFKCLELIAGEYVFKNDENKWCIKGPQELKQYRWDEEKNKYTFTNTPNFKNNLPTTFEKVAGLCFQLLEYKDEDVQQLYYSIKRRNEFIHPSEKKLTDNLKTECDKIYFYEGYKILLEQVSQIIQKLLA
ncbi:response regulator transcription factor [Tenuifilum thalassicum]|uniref:Response regulator n=1 Tax=Tenuifilum thalassicum TaxID=2590900 RepID=A0A7D3XJX2_9BACT|nr:response regulator transcription factor [Tenuifilum thalassicum]QKG79310.1 response regulator [Tenuifilum thalassicum]